MSGSSAHYAGKFCYKAEGSHIMREGFVQMQKVGALCGELLLWSGRSPQAAGRFHPGAE